MQRLEALHLRAALKRVGGFSIQADFTVEPGQRACLVGRSGSGKSTLLRMIAGLESLDSGQILIGERDITGLIPERRDVGFVFQEQALFPSMNVLENAAFGLKIRGAGKAEREEKVRPWLERLGLAALAGSSIGTLSGGERQRVAFIRALIWNPRILLLDEPFSALDTHLRDILRKDLLELHRLWPAPLVLVTHDSADVHAIATMKLEIDESSYSARKIRVGQP